MVWCLPQIWRPAGYHGQSARNHDFFEGWFFKFVDPSRAHIYAFIPGILLGSDPHSFIQILDGQTHQSDYIRFRVDQFWAASDRLDIQIGDNHFNERHCQLQIRSGQRTVFGRVEFGPLRPWPVKLWSPGAMGWYAIVPFMECFHGVISFDHPLSGTLTINDAPISFENGRGYIEKDWGRSFPSAYIWIQSNHFDQPGISLMASIANIPWFSRSFRGFIIALWLHNRMYRFATYTGAELDYVILRDDQVEILVKDRHFALRISAVRTSAGLLRAPYANRMLQRISESLNSSVSIELFQRSSQGERLIYRGTGEPAGLDVNGKLEEIIDR